MKADDASDNTRNGRIRRNNPFCDLVSQSEKMLAVVVCGISQQEQVDVDPRSAVNQCEAAWIVTSKASSLRSCREFNGVGEGLNQPQERIAVRIGFYLTHNRQLVVAICEEQVQATTSSTSRISCLEFRPRRTNGADLEINEREVEKRSGINRGMPGHSLKNSNAPAAPSTGYSKPSHSPVSRGTSMRPAGPTASDLDSSFLGWSKRPIASSKFQRLPRSWNPRSGS